jgi:dolichol-phosphate mannosyltransferase
LAKGETSRQPSTEVIIAALNEEEGIGLTIAELMDTLGCPRVIVVDGRSTDRTVEIAKNMGAEIYFQNGLGKGDALAKAIEKMNPESDYVVLTDADHTYPAEYVPEMIQILEDNTNVGMVCGNRFNGELRLGDMHHLLYFGNRLIAFTHNLLNGITLEDPLTGLRVLRTEILRSWRVKSQGFDIEVELNHHVERKGFGIAEVQLVIEKVGTEKTWN